jgi:hypothetical protein
MLKRKVNQALFCLALLLLVPALGAAPALAEELPRLGIALAQTSVSSLSSGAYMAGQIEVAHSKDIVGAGIVAGGPFACAETESSQLFPYWPIVRWQNAAQATNACMKVTWGAPDADKLAKRAKALAEAWPMTRSISSPATRIRPCNAPWLRQPSVSTLPRECLRRASRWSRRGGHAFLTETDRTACGLSKEP